MKKDERAVCLTASEFLAIGSNGLNQQVASARWQLILALQRNVPEFFERLRGEVYPVFGRLSEPRRDTGASFAMWQSRSELGAAVQYEPRNMDLRRCAEDAFELG
jgi:hypothetical protein